MKRLHDKLPEHGWQIDKYARAKSKAQQLQLEAFHKKDKYLVEVELLLRDASNTTGSKEDILSFAVSSPTYSAPTGVDLRSE